MPARKDATTELLPFAERLNRVLDGEMAAIERTLKAMEPANNAEAEHAARVLAALLRTVQDIQVIAEGQSSCVASAADAVPGDIDAFRAVLARRLEELIEA